MFQIKICGVTTLDDALAAVAAGADAIGLNFHPASPRYVDPRKAAKIAAAIGDRAKKVGVFVNRPPEEILEIAGEYDLDFVQLHGDEPSSHLAKLAGHRVIRAFRLAGSAEPARHFLDACGGLDARPSMLLVDAAAPGVFGGSGQTADWEMLVRERTAFCGLPIILAGGLRPENVGAAIRQVRPAGVDVASGVEISPGRKSEEAVRAFVAAAREAFAAVELQS